MFGPKTTQGDIEDDIDVLDPDLPDDFGNPDEEDDDDDDDDDDF